MIDETDGKADGNDVAFRNNAAPLQDQTIQSGLTANSSLDQESFFNDGYVAVKHSSKAEQIRFLRRERGRCEGQAESLFKVEGRDGP